MSYLQTEKYNFTDFAPEVWLYAQTCTRTQTNPHRFYLCKWYVCTFYWPTFFRVPLVLSSKTLACVCMWVSNGFAHHSRFYIPSDKTEHFPAEPNITCILVDPMHDVSLHNVYAKSPYSVKLEDTKGFMEHLSSPSPVRHRHYCWHGMNPPVRLHLILNQLQRNNQSTF